MMTTTSAPSIAEMATFNPAQLPRLGVLPERFTVEVTRLDIAYAIRESGGYCPIALAVRRALALLGVRIKTLDVDSTNVDFLLSGAEPFVWLPYRHDATGFVKLFDEGHRVQPCQVTLQRFRPIRGAA